MRYYEENLTNQSLSSRNYLRLLGICTWVFQMNVEFIYEMIDKEHHDHSDTSWYTLINYTSGRLAEKQKSAIRENIGDDAFSLFSSLIGRRNQIIHGLPSGKKFKDHPIMIYRSPKQGKPSSVDITDVFLEEFIKDNNKLSSMIHMRRQY